MCIRDSCFGTFCEKSDDTAQCFGVVFSIRPVGSRKAYKKSIPSVGRGKRRIGGQDLCPAGRKSVKRAWLGAEKRSEPPNPGLGNTAHEDIGKRCRCLPFPCGRYADTVYERCV